MAVKTRRMWTNFSKGELSPLVEGRPDIAAYYEGGKTIENFLLLRQGGLTRRPGTRFIAEVKNSAKETILLPFEASVNDAFAVEVGDLYMRFIKNKAQLKVSAGGPPVEVVSPYTEAQLRNIHFTQSVDIMFLFHQAVAQRQLARVSDTNWSLTSVTYKPPPSFEKDTDLATTLGVAANTGNAIKFRAGADVFLAGDVGRQVIAGAGRAVITALDNARQVTVDVIDAFNATITAGPNTLSTASAGATSVASTAHGLAVGNYVVLTSGPQSGEIRRVVTVTDADNFVIDAAFSAQQTGTSWNKVIAFASGAWFLRLSPQTTLDPNIKEPVGAQITLVAGANAFRSADVGKFIVILGGLVQITIFDSALQVRGEILSVLSQATQANPPAVAAGAWSLEVSSWSVINGFPKTGEFFQGRLGQAATPAQRTTFWLSQPDDFDKYAIGATAGNAVEYTIAVRQFNEIEWLADQDDLFVGTAGAELRAIGGREGEPIGGDVVPLVRQIDRTGSAAIQQATLGRRVFFVDRSRRKIYTIAFALDEDSYDTPEVTAASEHITSPMIQFGHIAIQRRLDPRLWFVRTDGVLVTLTFFRHEKVIGFTRLVTDGFYEAVCSIPKAGGGADEVYAVVRRTIGGQTKRYIELFDEDASEFASRAWTGFQTDCAVAYNGSSTSTITGLTHLNGKTVDVVAEGSFKGTKVVSGGQITLDEPATQVEVGLHYDSDAETMRPAVPGVVIEGIPRSWDKLFARLYKTRGGKINGEFILYEPGSLDVAGIFTGDRDIPTQGWDNDGRVRIQQTQPYPMTLLAVFGELSLGDHG